jgi:16S rRNA (guanine527-N7)-methyltransferase
VDKTLILELQSQSQQVGVALSDEQADRLGRFLDLLLVWNKKVNLTSLADPLGAIEGHLVDSLAALPELQGAASVLDLGAGGGFPSIPLAVVAPETRFQLVDAVSKKVGFLKAAIAGIGLQNAKALHCHANGRPQEEKIEQVEAVIARAFMPLPEYLALAAAYLAPGGRVVAMLGPEVQIPKTLPAGLRFGSERAYRLPKSGAARRLATFLG